MSQTMMVKVGPKERRKALSYFAKLMKDKSVTGITMETQFDQPIWLDDVWRTPLERTFIGASTTFTVRHIIKIKKQKQVRR